MDIWSPLFPRIIWSDDISGNLRFFWTTRSWYNTTPPHKKRLGNSCSLLHVCWIASSSEMIQYCQKTTFVRNIWNQDKEKMKSNWARKCVWIFTGNAKETVGWLTETYTELKKSSPWLIISTHFALFDSGFLSEFGMEIQIPKCTISYYEEGRSKMPR